MQTKGSVKDKHKLQTRSDTFWGEGTHLMWNITKNKGQDRLPHTHITTAKMQTKESKSKKMQTKAKKHKQKQANASKCKQTQAKASKCKQMHANANTCKPM